MTRSPKRHDNAGFLLCKVAQKLASSARFHRGMFQNSLRSPCKLGCLGPMFTDVSSRNNGDKQADCVTRLARSFIKISSPMLFAATVRSQHSLVFLNVVHLWFLLLENMFLDHGNELLVRPVLQTNCCAKERRNARKQQFAESHIYTNLFPL